MIRISNQSASDCLIEALQDIEGCKNVVIMLESEESTSLIANCGYRDISWLLDQAKFIAIQSAFEK